MEREQVKAIFRQYQSAKRAYNAACITADRVRREADGLRAIRYDGDKVNGSGSRDAMADAVEKIMKCVEAVDRARQHYTSIMVLAEKLLALADDADGAAVIRLRWLENMPFDFIPAKICMDRRTMFRHYNAALDEIAGKTKS